MCASLLGRTMKSKGRHWLAKQFALDSVPSTNSLSLGLSDTSGSTQIQKLFLQRRFGLEEESLIFQHLVIEDGISAFVVSNIRSQRGKRFKKPAQCKEKQNSLGDYLFIWGFLGWLGFFLVEFYWAIKGIKEKQKLRLKHAGLTLASAWRKQNNIPAQKKNMFCNQSSWIIKAIELDQIIAMR